MLRLKLSYDGEHRRCGVPGRLLTLGMLRERGKCLFAPLHNTNPQKINFQWVDDEGDIITVSSDVEVEESVTVMRGEEGETLHYSIITSATPFSAPAETHTSQEQEHLPRHHGVKCDECGMRSITGVRFKCSVRRGYNICSLCESRRPQPYPMIKIYTPQQRGDVRQWKRRLFAEGTVPPRCGFGENTGSMSVHSNVQCDHCEAYPVTGIRYKSLVLPDYDLCEKCEASDADAKSHPMLKIYHHGQLAAIPPPKWLLRERAVAERKLEKEQIRNHRREERQRMMAMKNDAKNEGSEMKEQEDDVDLEVIITALSSAMSDSCTSIDQPSAAPSVAAQSMILANVEVLPDEEAEEVAEDEELTVAKEADCDMVSTSITSLPEPIASDDTTPPPVSASEAPVPEDDISTKMDFTDKDLDLLMQRYENSTRYIGGRIVYANEQMSESPASIARFVCDITFPAGHSVMYPGTVFYKTWRVMNTSDMEWPSSRCLLVSAGGDRLMSGLEQERRNEVYLPRLQPNQTMDVTLQLTAPAEPGRYVGYFRFVDVNLSEAESTNTSVSRLFGDRLFADIEVLSMEPPLSPQEREDTNGWMMIEEDEPDVADMMVRDDHGIQPDEEEQQCAEDEIRDDAPMMSDVASAACGASLMSAADAELKSERYSEVYDEWGPELDVLNSMGFDDIEVLEPLLVTIIPSQFRGNHRGGRISEDHMQQLLARLC